MKRALLLVAVVAGVVALRSRRRVEVWHVAADRDAGPTGAQRLAAGHGAVVQR
jgi:hypothetical protein